MEAPKKFNLNIRQTYEAAIPLLGIHPNNAKAG